MTDETKRAELSDEELEQVNGGVDRGSVTGFVTMHCPYCRNTHQVAIWKGSIPKALKLEGGAEGYVCTKGGYHTFYVRHFQQGSFRTTYFYDDHAQLIGQILGA